MQEGIVLQDVLGLDRINRLPYKQKPKVSIPKSIAAVVMQSTVVYYPRNREPTYYKSYRLTYGYALNAVS